ncbi:MAG TPA: SRPBCC family protein [Burkholderiales bacterium]|nr:SRPBCC family protein [Burkholderiales bacterium]
MSRTVTARPVTLVEPGTVRLERLLPGPLERVWAYITESDKRAKWLCAGEFDLRVGGKVTLEFDNSRLSGEQNPPGRGAHVSGGVITRLEPPRLLSHTWEWKGNDTEVTYELTPRGKDVLLVIVHRRIAGGDMVPQVMGGWDVHTGILEDLLKGVAPRPFWKTQAKLAAEYAATL